MIRAIFKEYIDPEKVYYVEWPQQDIYSVIDNKVVPNKESIAKLKQYALTIVDLSAEHWGDGTWTEDIIYNFLEDENIKFIVLSHYPENHQRRPQTYFSPHWYHVSRNVYTSVPESVNNINRTYKISCLSGTPRTHRIYNYLLFQKKPYLKDSFVTIHPSSLSYKIRHDEIALDTDVAIEWNNTKVSLPEMDQKIIGSIWRSLDGPTWTDSYVNLISETTIFDKVFITEKTWKPIVCGQLFLLFGNPGSIAHLQDLGVDVFDDYIDHKYYDREPDWKIRIHKIHELLADLVKQDLVKIYQQTQDRRLLNSQNFIDGKFDQQYFTQIVEAIRNNS
jgi:hypothetical protein